MPQKSQKNQEKIREVGYTCNIPDTYCGKYDQISTRILYKISKNWQKSQKTPRKWISLIIFRHNEVCSGILVHVYTGTVHVLS